MTNLLPISKIFLAGFAFVLTHWKKIIEISILPLLISTPFLLIFPDLWALIIPMLSSGDLTSEVILPDNTLIYLILFTYGYFTLSINMYRLVVLGARSVNAWMPIIDFGQILRFIGLHLLIGIAAILPVMLTGLGFLQLVVYFLIIPLTLNFINIAINQPAQYRWNLSFIAHSNLFFLQIILPILVGLLFDLLGDFLGLGVVLDVGVKIIMFYWTLVTLGLCYQLIQTQQK